ncbi:MAG TPA: glycosyltransferase [Acidimicrobiales bacterium]|nr:glycosyltransferase [Acidimicrobiales bacterium]
MTDPPRSLVIPAYREAARIGGSLERLAASPLVADTEVLVVDDGSDDDTADIVRAVFRRTALRGRLVRRGRNLGKGAAVRVGLLAARGDVVVFTDADLSTPVPDIVACFERLERNEADVVFASRAHPDSTMAVRAPRHRTLAGRNFNRLLRGLGLTEALDTQCGLKGFRAEAARRIGTELRTNGFAFDVEILARAERDGLRVQAMPVTWSHVEASRVRPLRDGLAMTADAVRIRLRLTGGRRDAAGERVTMTDEDVATMAEREGAHWWFAAKRNLVLDVLADLNPASRVVDVGAGGGALVADLRARGHRAWALDLSPVTARRSRAEEGSVAGLVADAARLPLRPGALDAITSLDVIEHLDDDAEALEGYRAALRPGGRLVVTVPAYEWAWSEHDARLGHRRRYDTEGLRGVLEGAGFAVDRLTHFHSWLVPPAVAVRRTPLGRLVGDQEEAGEGGLAGRALGGLTRLERAALARMDLPVGLSLLGTAHRPG